MEPERFTGHALQLRPEIELAWHRATMSGLDPGMEVREGTIADIELRSSLSIAAGPVLDKMVEELADTNFSVLLADKTSRIVDRRVNTKSIGQALDRVLAVPGFRYLEEDSGTNALATAFEVKKPIAVTGDEHFLEALRSFCCYGAPIVHPVTHRLEGVLDVSGPVGDATALLGPFLMRAARDIEERLLEGSRVAEKQLLAEFQAHTSTRRHAVIALGENLVLTNTAAVDLIKGADHVALRAIAADLRTSAPRESSLVLASGTEVSVRARAVAGSLGGAVFDITRAPGIHPTSVGDDAPTTPHRGRVARAIRHKILVTGEAGTGKTTTAQTLVAANSTQFDAADSIADESTWFLEVRSALTTSQPTIIDNIDLLDTRLARRLAAPIAASSGDVVLTSAPLAELSGPHRVLASLALTRRELPALRTNPQELAGTVKSVLAQLLPDSDIEVAPSALHVLALQLWPGNIRELSAVLNYAARGRACGQIIESDLPESILTNATPLRTLSPVEAAERDVIVAVLRASNGNKATAATKLGIGRTTLYARIRRYRISDA